MKKNLFFILPIMLSAAFFSCAGDQCELPGTWQVKSVDVVTAKWPETIVEMTKSEYMKSVYQFNADGTLTITGSSQTNVPVFNWTQNAADGTVEWKVESADAKKEVSKILACSDTEMTLSQRIPADPALEESATITVVLSRTQ